MDLHNFATVKNTIGKYREGPQAISLFSDANVIYLPTS